MFCGKCGSKNEDGAKFCSSCGAPLMTAAPAAAPVQPEPAPVQPEPAPVVESQPEAAPVVESQPEPAPAPVVE
ncbi:MAG: zinc-ribbon domain-containing protein, partial [Ruminiclostridium sp.]|nr:zinc-ribbon domain-containing protein [Ruminiclostridium sp.]